MGRKTSVGHYVSTHAVLPTGKQTPTEKKKKTGLNFWYFNMQMYQQATFLM